MSSYTSNQLKTFTAKSFRDSFKEVSPRRIGYVFISNSLEYPNPSVIPSIVDSVDAEKQIWDNMIAAKKIIPKDVELVIPRYDWRPDTRYKQYDDKVPLADLLSESMDGDQVVYPMYAMNADGDVFLCICNNVNNVSTSEPIGNFTENNGFIVVDGAFIWKYMYNIKLSNKFLTEEWMPVPYIQANTVYTDYDYSAGDVIPGTLYKIIVTNGGSNYQHSTINVEPFSVGTSVLTVNDSINFANINTNMAITGTGIFENNTYITAIDSGANTITLSTPTISSGGGTATANAISIKTRVVVDGDGTETICSVRLNTLTKSISKIDVINAGINYTRANVTIYGSGTGATARVVLPPKLGHSYNPAVELGASNVMLVSRIGETDATENNVIPTEINFRQYGLLVNPYKYGSNTTITDVGSTDVISQTLDLTLTNLSDFEIGEKVYQGNVNNPSFSAYVVYQEGNIVKLNNVYKTPTVGVNLIGTQSGDLNPVVSIKNPDLRPYTGEVLFAKNITSVNRSIAQSEEVKLVFQF